MQADQLLPDPFVVLAAWPALTAIVGDPPAVFRGTAPEGTPAPYVAWFTAGQEGDGALEVPATDRWQLQVDAYSMDDRQCEALARAVRDAMEQVATLTGVPVDEQEEDTGLYRIGLQFDWWVNR